VNDTAQRPRLTKTNQIGVADRISIASPCPSLREPAGDAGRKPVDGARGCRFTQGKGWQCGRVRPCLCFTWPLGGWGALAGKRPPHKPRSDHNKTRHRPARPCCKRRRGDETPAPFCCPSTKEMDADLDLCGGIYPKGARHKGLLCEPEGRELLPARTLCIRRLYVKHRHTHNRRSRQRLNGTARGRGTFRLPMHQQPANGERLMA
jgi:hypothetical protein